MLQDEKNRLEEAKRAAFESSAMHLHELWSIHVSLVCGYHEGANQLLAS